MTKPPRVRVVLAAQCEIGATDPARYWESCGMRPPYPALWSGAFALWCLHDAGLAVGWRWDWNRRQGFLWRLCPTSFPEPGDIAYFARGEQHAIVEAAETEWGARRGIHEVQLITDNGLRLSTVAQRVIVGRTSCDYGNVSAFFSIDELIAAEAPTEPPSAEPSSS